MSKIAIFQWVVGVILMVVFIGIMAYRADHTPTKGEVNAKWIAKLHGIEMTPEEAQYMQITFPVQDITFDFDGMTVIDSGR